MTKRDPSDTLRQMREFAVEANDLTIGKTRKTLDEDLGFRRRAAELISQLDEIQAARESNKG